MKRTMTRIACFAGWAALAAAASSSAYAAGDGNAVLRFAGTNGGIKNWQPDESTRADAILIEGRGGDWYRATFQGPCPELRYAHGVAFVPDALGNLDRFTSIIVEGRRCPFKTFERTGDPDERSDGVDIEGATEN